MSRRSDRALPSLTNTPLRTWLKTLPLFILAITLSSLAIFNYQKSSSSTINSILYALRTNQQARELLGDEIYFASKVPWIRGELNQLHGRIDVRFWVKGTKAQGETRFKSERKRRDGFFETSDWSLFLEDGRVVQLLDAEGARDPLGKM
jgi:cytochrome c oxidase assembly factor 1